jgi:dolichol-phosphate mannosyltransferase
MKVSFVIPAKNEEEVIGKMTKMLILVYGKFIREIIIINDASTDDTEKAVKDMIKFDSRVKLINRRPPSGVGRAIREGLKKVSKDTDYVFTFDADFIRNIPDLDDFFSKIKDFDGLIGSRYLEKNSLVFYPALKRICNRTFHTLVYLFLNIKNTDLTNNFKLYKKEVFDNINLSENGYAINAETGLYPILAGYNIGELPVTWFARTRKMGTSKFVLFKVMPDYIRVLINSVVKSNNFYSGFFRLFQPLFRQTDKKSG